MVGGKRINPVCIIVIAIVIVGAIALSIDGLVQMEWKEETESGTGFSATITAYNNGLPVSEPMIMGAFTRSGAVVDSFVVTINWISSGSGIEWNTFALNGVFEVSFLNEYDNWIEEYSITFSSLDATSQWTKTLTLGVEVCKTANILYGGWFLQFECDISASVADSIGQVFTDDLYFVGTTNIVFESGFNLDGDMQF